MRCIRSRTSIKARKLCPLLPRQLPLESRMRIPAAFSPSYIGATSHYAFAVECRVAASSRRHPVERTPEGNMSPSSLSIVLHTALQPRHLHACSTHMPIPGCPYLSCRWIPKSHAQYSDTPVYQSTCARLARFSLDCSRSSALSHLSLPHAGWCPAASEFRPLTSLRCNRDD